MALFGSDLEKKIKAASSEKEHAWDGLGDSVTLRVRNTLFSPRFFSFSVKIIKSQ